MQTSELAYKQKEKLQGERLTTLEPSFIAAQAKNLCPCEGEKPIDLFKVSVYEHHQENTKRHRHALQSSDGQPTLFQRDTLAPPPHPLLLQLVLDLFSYVTLRFQQVNGKPGYFERICVYSNRVVKRCAVVCQRWEGWAVGKRKRRMLRPCTHPSSGSSVCIGSCCSRRDVRFRDEKEIEANSH